MHAQVSDAIERKWRKVETWMTPRWWNTLEDVMGRQKSIFILFQGVKTVKQCQHLQSN